MNKRFQDQTIVIVGATGGLGTAFAEAFKAEGAQVIIAARRLDALKQLSQKHGLESYPVDITDADSVQRFSEQVSRDYPQTDVLINATGYDVRKSLAAHSVKDVTQSIDVNLTGAILLTRVFIPLMQKNGHGTVVHMGGFADGRLAFPYYSVDVATRAGLFSFVESMNRELKGSGLTVTYFSPSPAETDAERPYHALWQELGQQIVPLEAVASELLDAVNRKQQVRIMGGFATVFFAKLNAIFPAWADWLLLNHYRQVLKRYLAVT